MTGTLTALLASVAPFVEAAGAPVDVHARARLLIDLAPLRADVVFADEDGRQVGLTFRAQGTPELREAVDAFLRHGIGQLSDDAWQTVVRICDTQTARLQVSVDVTFGTATAALLPPGEADPVILFHASMPMDAH